MSNIPSVPRAILFKKKVEIAKGFISLPVELKIIAIPGVPNRSTIGLESKKAVPTAMK